MYTVSRKSMLSSYSMIWTPQNTPFLPTITLTVHLEREIDMENYICPCSFFKFLTELNKNR